MGEGVYFWDSDEQRALEWAPWKQSVGQITDPIVIGAIFTLGNCLDLTIRETLDLLAATHSGYVAAEQAAGLPLLRERTNKRYGTNLSFLTINHAFGHCCGARAVMLRCADLVVQGLVYSRVSLNE